MGQARKRAAGVAAAVAVVALIGAGCSDDDKDTAGNVTESAKATVGQVTETMKSQVGEATESAESSAAATETTIAGQTVQGPILAKYLAAGGPTSALGNPTGPGETAPGGGKYQEFVGGIVYWNESTQAHIVWGEICNAWEESGGPEGPLGYPVSDEKDTTDGQQSDFENGYITYIDGRTEVHQN